MNVLMSGKISDQVLEEIRARVDIVDLIGARVTLKKMGGTFKGCCPFHHEKTPSFHVNPVKQFYHCFGCGESGDIFTFLIKQDGLSFWDAVHTLAERVGVVIQQDVDPKSQSRDLLYALHTELAAFYRRCLLQKREAELARSYLETRKIPDEIAEQFGIGYAPAQPRGALLQWGEKHGYSPEQLVEAGILAPPRDTDRPGNYFDRFRGRLMFPICDRRGRVVAFSARILDPKAHPAKYVNSPETDIFIKSRTLYALDKAAAKIAKHPNREAIICEGQIDVIRCHASGFETAVASQGTAFTKEHVMLLKKYADSAVLVFDGDNAGHKAALRTGALFLEEEMPVRVASLAPGEDPDSFLRENGATPFRELLENAQSITAFQVDYLTRAEDRPDSIDAVNRVAHSVLEMLAPCPGAVLRMRLLQEAAALLHLPYSAMEADLDKHIAAFRQRGANAETRHVYEAQTSTSSTEDTAPQDNLEPSDADRDEEDSLDSPPAPEPPSRTEVLLCEFLIEHEHDGAVLELVEHYLPIDIIVHAFTRSVVDAVLAQRRSGEDRLAALCTTTEPVWQPLLNSLLANKQKMLSAREMTKEEAIRDFIRRLWVARLEWQRGQLPVADTPETSDMRLRFTCLIKEMKSKPWDKIIPLMTVGNPRSALPYLENAEGAVTPAGAEAAAAAAFSGHAADSASGAGDPEEFPPSEYPPDETPD